MKKSGIELIAEERKEQIEKHGKTVDFDVKVNHFGQIKDAAIMLLGGEVDIDEENHCPFNWDDDIWDKMMGKSKIDRLIIAGALIAAEIDRLQSLNNPPLPAK